MKLLISFMADALVVPLVVIGAVWILKLPRVQRGQALVRGTLVALTALWLAKLMSLLYQGTRPFEQLGVAPGASYLPNPGFPSDHALLVFVIAAVVYASTGSKRVGWLLLACAVLVSIGRVLALVHTVPDVLGSLGCVVIASFIWYGPTLRQRYFAS